MLKEEGDAVLGGTLNLDGDLTIQVTEVGEKSTLARVVELVKAARESKGRYQRLADRAAAVICSGGFGDRPPGLWVPLGSWVRWSAGCGRVWRSR